MIILIYLSKSWPLITNTLFLQYKTTRRIYNRWRMGCPRFM